MVFGRFEGGDLFSRVGHQFSDLFGGIGDVGDGLGIDGCVLLGISMGDVPLGKIHAPIEISGG